MSAEIATGITEDPLDAAALINSARRDTCGAVASFIGVVRNHDGGESVDAIEYSSAVAAEHRAQAFRAVETIVEDVKAKLPIWKKQELSDGSHNWSGL